MVIEPDWSGNAKRPSPSVLVLDWPVEISALGTICPRSSNTMPVIWFCPHAVACISSIIERIRVFNFVGIFFRPFTAPHSRPHPGLTPWAAIFRRIAAGFFAPFAVLGELCGLRFQQSQKHYRKERKGKRAKVAKKTVLLHACLRCLQTSRSEERRVGKECRS